MPLSTSSLQVLTALLLLTWTGGVFTKKKSFQCPLDFKLSLTEDGLPICYRLKEPEAFSEQFKDCIGNLYTSKLYLKLDLPNETNAIWTEYMTIYPGGPFMDRSYTYTNGKTFTSSFDVKYDSSLGLDEELCVVLDPVTNYTAVRCDEKYHRYCFVKPYSEEDIGSSKGCPDISWRRYFTPSSTCLKSVIARGGSAVRAKWSQAQDLCKKREAALLREGWRYANSLVPNTPELVAFYPLGLEMNSNQVLHSADNESLIIPQSEWRFKDLSRVEPNCSHGAIRSGAWTLVNSSFVFLDVICERSVPLRNINLTLDEDLILHVDDSIKLKEIQCFTDTHFSVEAEVTKVPGADRSYRVIPTINGYYWCTHTDVKNYHPSESNRQLYIESHRSVLHTYAVKMRVWKRYTVLNSSEMVKLWKIKLAEYIYYGNMYLREYGKLPEQDMEETLQMYKESRPEQSWQDGDVIGSVEVRRMFLDARSVLLHVRLNAVMKPIMTPGGWGLLETVVMKPLYFCEGFGTVPTKEMGQTVTQGCRTFTCVGEYNEGVQWVETASEGCTTHASVQTMVTVEDSNFTLSTRMEASTVIVHKGEVPTEPDDSSSEEFPCCLPVTTTTTGSPTEWTFTTVNTPLTTEGAVETTTVVVETEPPPLAPDEQLQQVVVELEHLLESDAPVALESIAHPFDQVNSVLDVEDPSLEIPGQLLQLLDELAARVKLATGQVAMEVRDNVAMLMADAAPDNPVRGVRVAARDYDVFSNTSFGFINDTVDSGQLLRNTSEAVVYLPASVSATPRRVSFVAFRNQRAFPSPLTVNSRVFSVKVENLTQFEDGESMSVKFSKRCDSVPEASFVTTGVINNEQFVSTVNDSSRPVNMLLRYDEHLINVKYNHEEFSMECSDDYNRIALKHYNQNSGKHGNEKNSMPSIFMYLRSELSVAHVLEEFEVLLQNKTVSLASEQVDHLMNQVDTLLGDEVEVEIPGNLLRKLDQLGSRVSLKAQKGLVVRSNFAVLAADSSPETPVRGIRLAPTRDHFASEMFQFCDGSPQPSTTDTEAMVLLPESMTKEPRRVSFVAFRTEMPFHDRSCAINSRVIGVTAENFDGFHNGELVEIHLNPFSKKIQRNQTRVCAYWHINANGSGHWAQDGCSLAISEEGQLDVCRCNHLTHFAEILITRPVFSELNESILEIISVIGCCTSIVGIILIAITAAAFKTWRANESNRVWLHLCSAVFLLNVCFLLTVYIHFKQADVGCIVVGVTLHYSVLATYCWMLVISILSYRKLVLVFTSDIRYKLLVSSIFCWGFPMLVIGILFAVDSSAYTGRYEEITPSGNFCYPTGVALWVSVYAPIGAMWFVNWCLYGIIIRSMTESREFRMQSSAKENLRPASVSCLLAFICGIPWVFGFFARSIVAAYLFTITVTFQGFVLFLFFILGSKKTRDLWIEFLSGRSRRQRHRGTSSGGTNRSKPTKTARFYLDESSTPLTESRL